MTATLLGNRALVKLLLQAGANAQAKDKNGETALDIALEEQNMEIVRILTEHIKGRENLGHSPA